MKISITVQDDSKKNKLNYVVVNLSDGKKQIINKNIKVLLNNTPLELFVRTGNYYDKHSYYGANDLLRKESYYFEIILPDSTKLPLAFIKPNKAATAFNYPENISADENFVLKWTNLSTPHQLNISTGVEVKKKRNTNITEYKYKVRPTDTLKLKEGEYVVPKTYFIDSLTTTKSLTMNLTRRESGLINPSLLKSSSITYYHIIERTINFKEKD